MTFLGLNHPFFIPLWRRAGIVAILAAWAIFEFLAGSALWGGFATALGLYCSYAFFAAFDPPSDNDG